MNPTELIDGEWRRQAEEWKRSLITVEALLQCLIENYEKHKDQLVLGLLFIRAQTARLSETDKSFIKQYHLESYIVELQRKARTA